MQSHTDDDERPQRAYPGKLTPLVFVATGNEKSLDAGRTSFGERLGQIRAQSFEVEVTMGVEHRRTSDENLEAPLREALFSVSLRGDLIAAGQISRNG